MKDSQSLATALEAVSPTPYAALPDISLYMDQVLEYLSRTPVSLRQDDRLTAAMVNNYTKDGLLPRANGKRYSQTHLISLALISRLKQVLSVKDTGALLSAARDQLSEEALYTQFCRAIGEKKKTLMDLLSTSEKDPVALAMDLAVESYLCRIVCEALIDAAAPAQEPPSSAPVC